MGELDVIVQGVEVFCERGDLIKVQDCECVIHIPVPKWWWVCEEIECSCFKILHVQVGYDG